VASPGRPKRSRSHARTSRSFEQASARLARRVRRLREQLGLTQEAAAQAASIEPKHWQLIEVPGSNPTLATLVAVAKALRVEPHQLLNSEER
jgi:transcriptional regulator with XRE-family HTH domain